ncbi:MAG: hypothetical protein JXM70_09535 [Pirellulales bacterium]|nr:hypothetical protein [Pirellulales bacterium]
MLCRRSPELGKRSPGRKLPGRKLLCELLEDRRMLSGLTLITHGWNSGVDDWVDSMANEIRARVPDVPGTDPPDWLSAEYTLEIQGSSPQNITGHLLYLGADGSTADAMQATSGEVVIKLDWSAIDTQSESASFVGDYVSNLLLSNFGAPEYFDFLGGPIHLIGHSRGASLNTTIAERLAERGVWIDQFTTLDPHPVSPDDPINIWDNVRFADNYWEDNSFLHLFDGEEVPDAANLYFPSDSLPGGYGTFSGGNHSDIHLWYHGTIDTDGPIDDGSASVSEDAGWYDGDMGPRDQIGFYYSRIGGGERTGDVSAGLASSGNRVVSAQLDTQWANLESPLLYSGDSNVNQGTSIPIAYRYQATTSCDISFGYDSDRNPYNGSNDVATINKPATSSGSEFDNGSSEVHYFDTTSVPSGMHYLYAKITTAGHTRYAYTAGQVVVVFPGDANRDGSVDVSDLGILAANYGSSGAVWDDGDFNNDTKVDVSDLGILATYYGQTLLPPTSSTAAVSMEVIEPEILPADVDMVASSPLVVPSNHKIKVRHNSPRNDVSLQARYWMMMSEAEDDDDAREAVFAGIGRAKEVFWLYDK